MNDQRKLGALREVITENLRVQRGEQAIDYVNVGNVLQDACSKQNHAIFARRGCGKTLLLHHSSQTLKTDMKAIYLNCEEFKHHSFPNVLIEILSALFKELERNLTGWFGKKKKSKEIIRSVIEKLQKLRQASDSQDEDVTRKNSVDSNSGVGGSVGMDVDNLHLKLSAKGQTKEKNEVERSFKIHREKLQELDLWLPELKESVRQFFSLSKSTSAIIIQIDDLYHLKRTDQAFVVDYIHRLCKDVPLFLRLQH